MMSQLCFYRFLKAEWSSMKKENLLPTPTLLSTLIPPTFSGASPLLMLFDKVSPRPHP